MGDIGNTAYLSIAGTCDACAHNGGKQDATEPGDWAAEHPPCSTCAGCIDCTRFVYSVSNYSRIRTLSGVGSRCGSYWVAPWRLYYAQGSAPPEYTPRANSGRTDGVSTGRVSPLYWLAYNYWSGLVRAGSGFLKPLRNTAIQCPDP